MNGKLVGKRGHKTLPFMRPTNRTVATTVDVCLPPVRWSPSLIEQVASLLAEALVRDMQERPTETPERPS
jgi:hypothetical protein